MSLSLDQAKLEYSRALNTQVVKESIPLWMRLCTVDSNRIKTWLEAQSYFRCIYETVPDNEFARHLLELKVNEYSMKLSTCNEECSEYDCQLLQWRFPKSLELDEGVVGEVLRKINPSIKTKEQRREMITIPPDAESDEEEDAYEFYDKAANLVNVNILTDSEWTNLIHVYGIPESCIVMLRTLLVFSQLLRDQGPEEFNCHVMTVPCLCSTGHNLGGDCWSFRCLEFY